MTSIDKDAKRGERAPKNHRTIDRVTQILEEIVYNPGMTFSEIVRNSGAAKSSIYGFVDGLLAKGWLYEEQSRFYLGPAVYGLTIASGQLRAGMVTHEDLTALQEATGISVFLGVEAGDHLIYIEEAGRAHIGTFEARSNIRRTLLATAAGKTLLAAKPQSELEVYLRRRSPEEKPLVQAFLEEYDEIRNTGIAINLRQKGQRFAIAKAVVNAAGKVVAAVALVGATKDMAHREGEFRQILTDHVDAWTQRRNSPRELL
jgi:DNA-binding IclR family transcriptional regulator